MATNDAEHILDKFASENLIFGCSRIWHSIHFPDVLSHLILHYYGTTFRWTIEKDWDETDDKAARAHKYQTFTSKPFIINEITFQCFFRPPIRPKRLPKPNRANRANRANRENKDFCHQILAMETKIISMPNTIRTCTVYYEYSIVNHVYKSRHTYNVTSTRAKLPQFYLSQLRSMKYPIDLSIAVEPIRIHHWKADKVRDYQQDILMKEFIQYEWILDPKTRKQLSVSTYLQSNTFGCWCLDMDSYKQLFLKLLRLAPNITRIKIECCLQSKCWHYNLDAEGVLEFTFTNDMIRQRLNPPGFERDKTFHKNKDSVISVQIRIIEVYGIGNEHGDDFETNDVKIPYVKWSQYGIVP